LGECDEGILRGCVGVKNLCPPISPSTGASIQLVTGLGRPLAARLRLPAGLTKPIPGPRKASRRPSPSSTSPLAVTRGRRPGRLPSALYHTMCQNLPLVTIFSRYIQ